LLENQTERIVYPDEVKSNEDPLEGASKTIQVNSYERDKDARKDVLIILEQSAMYADWIFRKNTENLELVLFTFIIKLKFQQLGKNIQ
jgi:hypothetical protein